MEKIKIPDDIFEQETVNTIFEDYHIYLTMLIFCRFENRSYTDDALFRELHGINSEIKRQDVSPILKLLLNKDYVGIKDRRYYFLKESGIKAFKEVYNRLLEKSGYLKKQLKPRKSFYQEFHETVPTSCLYGL